MEGSNQGTPLRAQQMEKQAGIGQKGAKNNQGLGEMPLAVWPQPHCSLLPQDGVRHALGLLRQSERRAQVVHKEIFCLYPVGCGKGFSKEILIQCKRKKSMGSFLLSNETPGDAATVLGGSGSNPTIPRTSGGEFE